MAEGRSNQGICHALWLSPKTVETTSEAPSRNSESRKHRRTTGACSPSLPFSATEANGRYHGKTSEPHVLLAEDLLRGAERDVRHASYRR